MASAALSVVIALKYPHYFQILSVVLGLMTIYVVIMIDYLVHSLILHKLKGK
jgi:ATP synthase protein I